MLIGIKFSNHYVSRFVPIKLTLTLDNGPHPEVTPRVLDVLAQHQVTSTFFVVGQNLDTADGFELAKAAHDAGHRLGNHTWSHHCPLGNEADSQRAISEVSRAQVALGSLANSDRLFRPYAGQGIFGPHMMSKVVYDFLKSDKYSCVTWNCIPRDWEPGWVDRAIQSIQERPWSVVVLHDIPRGGTQDLDQFLTRARDLDVEFTTDFPLDCTPIWRGNEQFDFSENMTCH